MEVPNGIFADLDVRKAIVNGQEAIQIFKRTKYFYKKGQTIPPVIVPMDFSILSNNKIFKITNVCCLPI